jgi:hypothetical protein
MDKFHMAYGQCPEAYPLRAFVWTTNEVSVRPPPRWPRCPAPAGECSSSKARSCSAWPTPSTTLSLGLSTLPGQRSQVRLPARAFPRPGAMSTEGHRAWAEDEFGCAAVADVRNLRRLVAMAAQLAERLNPSAGSPPCSVATRPGSGAAACSSRVSSPRSWRRSGSACCHPDPPSVSRRCHVETISSPPSASSQGAA